MYSVVNMFSAQDAGRLSRIHNTSHHHSQFLQKAFEDIRQAATQGKYNTTIYDLSPTDVNHLKQLGYNTIYFFTPSYKQARYPCHVYW